MTKTTIEELDYYDKLVEEQRKRTEFVSSDFRYINSDGFVGIKIVSEGSPYKRLLPDMREENFYDYYEYNFDY